MLYDLLSLLLYLSVYLLIFAFWSLSISLGLIPQSGAIQSVASKFFLSPDLFSFYPDKLFLKLQGCDDLRGENRQKCRNQFIRACRKEAALADPQWASLAWPRGVAGPSEWRVLTPPGSYFTSLFLLILMIRFLCFCKWETRKQVAPMVYIV